MSDESNPIKEGRFRLVKIKPQAMLFIKQNSVFKTLEGIPDDSELVSSHYDPYFDVFLLKIASKEFDPTEEGKEIPNFGDVIFKRIEDKEDIKEHLKEYL